MLTEQIRQEIEKQVDEKISKQLEIFNLPLISTPRVLIWAGQANGGLMAPQNFAIADLQTKILVIKSIKLIPYTNIAFIDIFLNDGVTNTVETIPINARVNRIFDVYVWGSVINFSINGIRLPLLNSTNYPVDLFIDNLFYKFPQKIDDIQIRLTFGIYDDIQAATVVNPNMIFQMECYLI